MVDTPPFPEGNAVPSSSSTLEIKHVPVTVESRIQAVANGTVDIECGSTTIAISRQEQVDFTNPTFLDGGGLKDHNEGLSVLETGLADAYASDRTILIGLIHGIPE